MTPAHVAPRSPALLTDRRTLLRALGAAGLLTTHHSLRTLAQEATPEAQPLFTGESFVGETSDPTIFVAVVLGDEAGAEPRPARGYLCNGLLRTIDVWLTGEMTGEQLTLTAEDGSQLMGVQNAAGIGGGAKIGDGTSLLFTAVPAEGIAGLYTVAMLPEGRMEGSSASGGTLVGTLEAAAVPAGERFVYTVTVTPPAADAVLLTITTATTEEGTFRTILLPSGEGRGQGKTKKTGSWTDLDPLPRT
jgi:hypothetical protein